MRLKHFIIHEIEKNSQLSNPQDFAPKIVLKSNNEFPITNPASLTFAKNLREKYSSSISGYGCIDKTPNSIFNIQLQEYRSGKINFVTLSHLLLDRLHKLLSEDQALKLGTGGLIVLIEYEESQKDFLLITMIKEKSAITFDKKNFNLEEILSVDLDKLHEGARFDINKWENDSEPYISFIKKSHKLSDYFKESINCIGFTHTSTYTTTVHDCLTGFAEAQQWDDPTKKEKKALLREYFIQSLDRKTNNGKPTVYLKELSAQLTPEEPDEFYNYIRAQEIEVSDEFQPDNATVRRWKRITLKSGSINVTFDVSDYEEGKILLDDRGNIIITDVSAAVKQKFSEIKNL